MSALGRTAGWKDRALNEETMGTSTKLSWTRIETGLARLVMVVMAVAILFVGARLLTTPWAIPVTVSLWLGAAAIVGLGVFGELPHDV
jgi:hypothetical protein